MVDFACGSIHPTVMCTTTPPHGVDPATIAAFAQAWAIACGVAPPTPAEGGFYIEVGEARHRGRYILPALDPLRLRALTERITEPWVFIKVCAPGDLVRRAASPRWALHEPRFMMDKELALAPTGGPPDGYRLSLSSQGAIVVASIVDAREEPVAGATLAVAGELATLRSVRVDERHRRRGLASAMVRALEAEAVRAGARRGVLSATLMGRPVYAAHGWNVLSDYTTLVIAS
jgi:GNAT superfamily N-acetyltransferase